jgi:hypothetical protein
LVHVQAISPFGMPFAPVPIVQPAIEPTTQPAQLGKAVTPWHSGVAAQGSILLHWPELAPLLRPSQVHVDVVPSSFSETAVPAVHEYCDVPQVPLTGTVQGALVPPLLPGQVQVPAAAI